MKRAYAAPVQIYRDAHVRSAIAAALIHNQRSTTHAQPMPPSSTSPSPLPRQGRAQKSRLRRVSQSRMLAIPGATQWQ